jgi:hypothetical protein
MLHSLDFKFENATARGGKPIRAPIARAIVLLEAFNPALNLEAPQGPVKSARAQYNAAIAHLFHVLKNGVAMPGLTGKTQKHEENRFGKRSLCHMSARDMSSRDMLCADR